MSLSQKELNDLTNKLKNIPQTIPVQVFQHFLKNMHLDQGTDPMALEILNMKAAQLEGIKDTRKLLAYRFALSNYWGYLLNEVNRWNIYLALDLETDFDRAMTNEKLKVKVKNQTRNMKTKEEIDNFIVSQNKDIEIKKRKKEIAKVYRDALQQYIPMVTSKLNALNRAVDFTQKEWERAGK